MKKVRLGIVGCGSSMMYMYGHIFKYLENGEFTAAMDIDESKTRLAQARYGCKKIYTDYEKMLADEDIEAVIIATPVFLHKEQVIKAAEAGKHILCEKPLARRIDECDRMIESCKRNKVIMMTGFMKRFNKNFQIAKRIIEEGKLGDIVQIRVQWDLPAPQMDNLHWRYALPAWGGIYLDHGAHVIDLCRWWAGEIDTVSGEIAVLRPKSETDDLAVVTLRHKNGVVSLHHMTCMWHKDTLEVYELYGTKATLELKLYGPISCMTQEPFTIRMYEDNGRKITGFNPYKYKKDSSHSSPSFGIRVLDVYDRTRETSQYFEELKYFCDCIIKGKTPEVTGLEGRKAIEVINAACLSSWRGKKVKLPLKETPDLEKFFLSLRTK